MTDREIKELIGRTIASNKYKLTEYIGSGSFSAVFKVKELYSNEDMIAKMEQSSPTRPPLLSREFRIYQILRYRCGHKSIPKTYYFGESGPYYALVMQMLGPSLLSKYQECGQRFSVQTVALLALQMIDIFSYIHSRRIIFRDVKPENFLLGLPKAENENTIHVIDFGLAKEFRDTDGNHIPFNEKAGVTGTIRYMSINATLGREQSRRDDMEAIGHLLIYFLRRSMPWSGLNINDSQKLLAKTAQIKINTTPESLCADLPQEFCNYLKTVRALDFEEEPNYKQLAEMFEKLVAKEGKKTFDWNDVRVSKSTTNTSENICQTNIPNSSLNGST